MEANMLSTGGRSTLITSVLGSLGVYHIFLFPMPKQINKRLESLQANFFWGARMGSKKFHGSLEFGFSFKAERWSWIVGVINEMHDKGIIPHSSIKRLVKDGSATRFRRDACFVTSLLSANILLFFVLKQTKIALFETSGKMVDA
ncbi:hypothetical protein CTI12_AA333590 [Artemisia annua]|uniref:Uncharacterized protein n=1 Tax=Artemisia annua TaxID=35608 RepID=A0A2U1MWU2_ARTAN|nr:hypothetical protein CTI12_AA333590 [Artemisia annua]